uniref:Uncharacterized protein n=1 Tax=Ascaris lumbricoides TaxID=6252 RepID=A0A0M3IEZ0_ASCLU
MSWCARATTSSSCVFAHVRRLQSTTARIAELNRSFADGCVHVTSTNVENGERCVLRLQLANARTTRLRNEFVLPVDAIEGLKNALIDCSRLPKQLQYEADQLNEMLSQRRFPATPEEVREARKRIRKSLEEEEGGEINDDMFSQKVARFFFLLV